MTEVDPRPHGDCSGFAGEAEIAAREADADTGVQLPPAAADLLGALDGDQTDEEVGVGRMIAGEVARALSSPAPRTGTAPHRRLQSSWWRRP